MTFCLVLEEVYLSSVKVDFSEGFRQIKKFSGLGTAMAEDFLKEEIVKEISEGRSPVKRAGGRFKAYSPSYKKAIDKGRYSQFNKRKRPVNLRLSGELLKSIYTEPISKTKFRIGFRDSLAKIHNSLGAGKSKVVRRMLPTKQGETFTDNILFAVGTRLRRIARRVFR
jgi:hypothetical protein